MSSLSLIQPKYRVNAVAKADSSCEFMVGRTSAIVSLHGPVEARTQQSSSKAMIIDVSVRKPSSVPTIAERSIETIISDSAISVIDMARFPFTQLQISVEVISDDGSLVASILNAFVIACKDLGIQTNRPTLAVPLGWIPTGLVTFPNKAHEAVASATCTNLVCLTTGRSVYLSQAGGSITASELGDMIVESQRSVTELFDVLRL